MRVESVDQGYSESISSSATYSSYAEKFLSTKTETNSSTSTNSSIFADSKRKNRRKRAAKNIPVIENNADDNATDILTPLPTKSFTPMAGTSSSTIPLNSEFSLSWDVQFCGSYPIIGQLTPELITKKLDASINLTTTTTKISSSPDKRQQKRASKSVRISVSLFGISVSEIISSKSRKNQSSCQTFERLYRNAPILFSHSLRKVVCVIGRKETHQVAYITRGDPISRNGTDSTTTTTCNKHCHIFQTDSAFEVEEIETVLSNAFQRNANNMDDFESIYTTETPLKNPKKGSTKTISSGVGSKIQPTAHSLAHLKRTPSFKKSRNAAEALGQPSRTTSVTNCRENKIQQQQTPVSSRKNGFHLGFSKSRKQLTQSGRSAAFFQRLFGHSTTITDSSVAVQKSETVIPPSSFPAEMTPVKWQPENSRVKFRPKEEIKLPPPTQQQKSLENAGRDSAQKSSRKRRPVSAVFGHSVLQRISTATGIGRSGGGGGGGGGVFNGLENSKSLAARGKINDRSSQNHSSINNNNKNLKTSSNCRPFSTPLTISNRCSENANNKNEEKTSEKPIPLIFDEKLNEWIYEIDENFQNELNKLAYFCKNPNRDAIMASLMEMPIGSFVLRISGSRRQCLALNVRTPEEKESTKKISNYLIVRNEHGFRIKGSKHYFPTLPMLITHHSVINEQLPCRLIFADWDIGLLKGEGLNTNNIICHNNNNNTLLDNSSLIASTTLREDLQIASSPLKNKEICSKNGFLEVEKDAKETKPPSLSSTISPNPSNTNTESSSTTTTTTIIIG